MCSKIKGKTKITRGRVFLFKDLMQARNTHRARQGRVVPESTASSGGRQEGLHPGCVSPRCVSSPADLLDLYIFCKMGTAKTPTTGECCGDKNERMHQTCNAWYIVSNQHILVIISCKCHVKRYLFFNQ